MRIGSREQVADGAAGRLCGAVKIPVLCVDVSAGPSHQCAQVREAVQVLEEFDRCQKPVIARKRRGTSGCDMSECQDAHALLAPTGVRLLVETDAPNKEAVMIVKGTTGMTITGPGSAAATHRALIRSFSMPAMTRCSAMTATTPPMVVPATTTSTAAMATTPCWEASATIALMAGVVWIASTAAAAMTEYWPVPAATRSGVEAAMTV